MTKIPNDIKDLLAEIITYENDVNEHENFIYLELPQDDIISIDEVTDKIEIKI